MTIHIFQSIITFVTFVLLGAPYSEQPVEKCLVEKKYDEKVLKKQYLEFIDSLNYLDVVVDYRKAVKDLLSDNTERQIAAIKTLSQTNQPNVIPWMVPFLDSNDIYLRLAAANSIEQIVTWWALELWQLS